MSLPETIANVVELALLVSGLIALFTLFGSPAARARIAAPVLPFWEMRPLNFLLVVWCIVMANVAASVAAVQLLRLAAPLPGDTVRIVAGMAADLGQIAACLALRSPRLGLEAVPSAPAPPRPTRCWRGGTVTFLAALPLVELVELAWQSTLKATGVPLVEQDTLGLFIHAAPAMRATLLFFAVALAPVTEELVFRGVLFRYVRGRAPRWLALAGPALLFAALHQNLASLAGLFTLGLCFSLAYERTGDLRVPIVAHGLFNLHTALLVFAGVTK